MAFSKDAQVRIDQTVDVIVKRCPLSEQATVKTFLNQVFQGMFSDSSVMTAVKQIETFSDMSLSMRGLGNAGNKDERAMRRAISLLGALKSPVFDGKTLLPGQLSQKLGELVEDFRIYADECVRTGALLNAKFNELQNTPSIFLRENTLYIYGSQATAGLVNVIPIPFTYDYRFSRYKLDVTHPPEIKHPKTVNVVSVPAVSWYNVPGRGATPNSGSFAQIAATELTGADLAISTNFTGCALCFKEVGGRLFAAHIMPGGGSVSADGPADPSIGSGDDLARQLAGLVTGVAGGDFDAPVPPGGTFYVYGARYSNLPAHPAGYPGGNLALGQFMVFIGAKVSGSWALYALHVDRSLPRPVVNRVR